MASGTNIRKKQLKYTAFSYTKNNGTAAGPHGGRTYTKSNFGYSVPSGYSGIVGFTSFGAPYWSAVYNLNNSSANAFQVTNIAGGFSDTGGTARYRVVFVKNGMLKELE